MIDTGPASGSQIHFTYGDSRLTEFGRYGIRTSRMGKAEGPEYQNASLAWASITGICKAMNLASCQDKVS